MLLQVLGQFLGNTLPGAKLLFDVGQLAARFLEQELADAEIKGSVDVDEQDSCKQQNHDAVSLDQQRSVRDQESALVEQEKACGHEQNCRCEEDIGNHGRSPIERP